MVLYKYTTEDSGFRILEDLRLKITPPNEFNDPFETTPHSKFTKKPEEMVELVRTNPEYYRPVYKDMNREGAFTGTFEKFIGGLPKALIRHFTEYKKLSREELAKIDIRTPDTLSREMGILCLSKTRSSIPMWSYYADHHRGVVFGFNIDKFGGPKYWHSGFVKYRKQRVVVNPYLPPASPDLKKFYYNTVFTKSAEWSHEQEYRRVFQLTDLASTRLANGQKMFYYLDIAGSAIEEIILGCRTSPDLESQIRQELHRRKITFGHIRLFRCIKHRSKYALGIIPSP